MYHFVFIMFIFNNYCIRGEFRLVGRGDFRLVGDREFLEIIFLCNVKLVILFPPSAPFGSATCVNIDRRVFS